MHNYIKKGLILCWLLSSILPFGMAQFTVQGLLHIQGEASIHTQNAVIIQTVDGVIENNGVLAIEGNLEKTEEATFNANLNNQGARSVIFTGGANHRIIGDFTGLQRFFNLRISKNSGSIDLNNNIEVGQQLSLESGKLRTDIMSGDLSSDYQYEVLVSNPAEDAITFNSSDASAFVEGNLRRVTTGTNSLSFPVGQIERELATIQAESSISSSTIVATFENRTITQSGATVSCDGSETAIDCVLGSWNIRGDSSDDMYDLILNPSAATSGECADANRFFIAKDGVINCPPDENIEDGISADDLVGFGVFDIPTAENNVVATCALVEPVATFLGGRRSIIEWNPIPNAVQYRVQVRFKGMSRWIATVTLRGTRVSVFAPSNFDYEYRIQTICANEESDFTEVFEWSTRGDGLQLAESRNSENEEVDIILDDLSFATLVAFPNPVNNWLQVSYQAQSNTAQLEVYHTNGVKVLEKILNQNQSIHPINMQHLPAAIYFVTIREKGGRLQTLRIAKEGR